MFCPKCGKDNPPQAQFCYACGTWIPSPVLQPEPDRSQFVPQSVMEPPVPEPSAVESPKRKSKKKLFFLIGGGVAVLLALLVGGYFLMRDSGTPGSVERDLVYGIQTQNDDAVVSMMNGTCVTIEDEVRQAILTKDRKHIVILRENGELSVTDPALSAEIEIAERVYSIGAVRDEGIFYIDIANQVFRYKFSDQTTVSLGQWPEYSVADEGLAILCTNYNSAYYLAPDAANSEPLHIGGQCDGEWISNDGRSAAWADYSSDYSCSVRLFTEGHTYEVTFDEYESYGTIVSANKDQNFIVICNLYSDTLWIKRPGQSPVEADLGGCLASSSFYTQKGPLKEQTAVGEEPIYVLVEGNDYKNLVSIDWEGKRQRILTGIRDVRIGKGGSIVYIDEDGALYCGTLRDSGDVDSRLVAEYVEDYAVSKNVDYVYYLTDADYAEGALYCCQVSSRKVTHISDGVSYYEYSWSDGGNMCEELSADGKTVYFFRDLEEIGDTGCKMGTLMKWSYGDESPQRISGEVLVNSPSSGLQDGYLNSNGFMFGKFSRVTWSDDVEADIMYWDGERLTCLAEGVSG